MSVTAKLSQQSNPVDTSTARDEPTVADAARETRTVPIATLANGMTLALATAGGARDDAATRGTQAWHVGLTKPRTGQSAMTTKSARNICVRIIFEWRGGGVPLLTCVVEAAVVPRRPHHQDTN